MKKITVLIAEDHAIVRQAIRRLLETADDVQVVGEAEDGTQAVEKTTRFRPDVVLMDLSMPLLNGIEATRRIIRALPATEVIILSSYSDDGHVQQALEAGASGYLMKETASTDLLRAVRQARKGNAFFSPIIAMRLLKRLRNHGSESHAKVRELTGRQKEIIQLIAEGYSTKQMAGMLSLTLKTVEKHRQTVMNKLDIHNVATVTRYAVFSGLVDSNRVPFRPVASARALSAELPQSPALCGAELAVAP